MAFITCSKCGGDVYHEVSQEITMRLRLKKAYQFLTGGLEVECEDCGKTSNYGI